MYSCKNNEKISKSDMSDSEDFSFSNFMESSQFSLALEILRWFQNETLYKNPELLNKSEKKKLSSVNKRYTFNDMNSTASTDFLDTKFYDLPSRKNVEEKAEEKVEDVLQSLIHRIKKENNLKKEKRIKSLKKKASNLLNETYSCDDSGSDETIIKVIQTKPHKKKIPSHKLSENKENYQVEQVKKIYICDKSVQTEEVKNKKSDGDKISEYLNEVKIDEKQQNEKEKKIYKPSLAWYEPIGPAHRKYQKRRVKKVVSLKDHLVTANPGFVSRLKERQRLLSIAAEERKLEAVWRSDREKLFGKSIRTRAPQPSTRAPQRSAPQPRKKKILSRSEMIQYSKDKYLSLPEVKQQKVALQRKQQYAAFRENQKRFNLKIQNRVLRKSLNN